MEGMGFFGRLFSYLYNYFFNSQEGKESLNIVLWIFVPLVILSVILLVVYSVYFTFKMRKKDKENSR